MDIANVLTGAIAVLISTVLSIVLIFATYKLDLFITAKIDEEKLLLQGNKSVAIMLAAVLISQAYLLRHALYPTMVVIRNSLVYETSWESVGWAALYGLIFFLIIGVLSFLAVGLAMWLFAKMDSRIHEFEEILKDNVAVAIFLGAVVIAITLIVDEGMADLAKSIIPTVKRGVLTIK